MSPITITPAERVQALLRFGYTEREASFLCLVALNGGFFLRRQYCLFAKAGDEGTVSTFIEKLLRNEHGRMVTGFGNLRVYHLFARPIYNAIGQENNRNRRERAPLAMKSRLMSLDFVLEYPDHAYLVTEQEKVSYFTATLGIANTELPVKEFRSPTSSDSTNRYFIDRYPVFLPADGAGLPSVSFTFIDEGTITSSRFETYVNQYERLFARLAHFTVIYVAARDQAFAAAEKAFENFLAGGRRRSLSRVGVADPKRLAEYFATRQLWDTAQFDSFGKPEIIKLRNERDEFAGPFYEALYNRWKALGDQAFQEAFSSQRPTIDPARARFSTCLLPHNYDVFGN